MEHFHSTAAHPEHPGHAAAHGPHGHVHESQKAVVNRLARAIGHLEKVKRMVESGVDCSEVLIQLAAVRSAIDNTGKIILQDPTCATASSTPSSVTIARPSTTSATPLINI